MKYRIITLIGLAGSTLAVCFGGWDKFLQTLLCLWQSTGLQGESFFRQYLEKVRNLKMVHWKAEQARKGCAEKA